MIRTNDQDKLVYDSSFFETFDLAMPVDLFINNPDTRAQRIIEGFELIDDDNM